MVKVHGSKDSGPKNALEVSSSILNNIKKGDVVLEIKSDYSKPRIIGQNIDDGVFLPGEEESFIPEGLVTSGWVKAGCTPELVWSYGNVIRDADAFTEWLDTYLTQDKPVYVMGFALDCCVLRTVECLYSRGFEVIVLQDCTDTADGNPDTKRIILESVISTLARVW